MTGSPNADPRPSPRSRVSRIGVAVAGAALATGALTLCSAVPVWAATTTTVPVTTTTVPVTTTTTTPKKTSSGLSSAAVALIIVGIVVVLAVILLLILLSRRKRIEALSAWRRSVFPAVSDAHLARDALLSPNAMSDDAELRGAVEVQVDRSARALEQAALTAPDEAAQSATNSVARSLRGLAFAVEADRLLRHGAGAPTGTQLAEADDARRTRLAELDSSLARLSAQLGAPSSRR